MKTDVGQKIGDFFQQYPQRTYPKDQIAVFSGEAPEKVFYIVSGKISQYDISYRGDEIITNIFKPPAFFPMSWAINQTPNPYFFKAEETSVVRMAPPEDVVAFLKAHPDVLFDLLSRVYKGVDGVLARMVHLMAGSARSRLMYELLIECRRFGTKHADNSYVLELHEADLAARSGLARETVSRELKHLKEKGIAGIKDGHVVVMDLAELELQVGRAA